VRPAATTTQFHYSVLRRLQRLSKKHSVIRVLFSYSHAATPTEMYPAGIWAIRYLIDCSVSILFIAKKTPLRLWLTRAPGFSYVLENGHAMRVQAPDINLFSLGVLFGDKEADDHKEAGLIRRHGIDDDQEVVYDRSFECDHFHLESDQPPHMPPLNEQWWSLAHSDYKSTLSSTCGCN